MPDLPHHGGCLCGDVRYAVVEDPITLYACHCTDCQTQSGASFALSMIVRREALEVVKGKPVLAEIQLPDGRIKRPSFCARCGVRMWAESSRPGLRVVEPGTLDDTTWLRPVGHIWTRSAQAWIPLGEEPLAYAQQPEPEEMLEMVRAWKGRADA